MYDKEDYYVSVFYAYMKGLGLDCVCEEPTNKGRIDFTFIMPEVVFIMEFKVDEICALSQIKNKGYHEKYISHNKPIYLIGIDFNSKDRNVINFDWE